MSNNNDTWWHDILGHHIERIRKDEAMELNEEHHGIVNRMKRNPKDFPYCNADGEFPYHWKGHHETLVELRNAGYLREKPYFQGTCWKLTARAKELPDE
jgi:hypothetical protein